MPRPLNKKESITLPAVRGGHSACAKCGFVLFLCLCSAQAENKRRKREERLVNRRLKGLLLQKMQGEGCQHESFATAAGMLWKHRNSSAVSFRASTRYNGLLSGQSSNVSTDCILKNDSRHTLGRGFMTYRRQVQVPLLGFLSSGGES